MTHAHLRSIALFSAHCWPIHQPKLALIFGPQLTLFWRVVQPMVSYFWPIVVNGSSLTTVSSGHHLQFGCHPPVTMVNLHQLRRWFWSQLPTIISNHFSATISNCRHQEKKKALLFKFKVPKFSALSLKGR